MNVENYLNQSLTWEEYIAHINDVIANGDQSDDKYQYYDLNLKRIERLLKKTTLSPEQEERVKKLDKKVILFAITEGWCGDAAQILPVVEVLANQSPKLDTAFILRDSSDYIEHHLTNGGKSIPIVVGVDAETKEEIFVWGPRPEWAKTLLAEYRAGKMNHDEFVIELQKSYNKDKGNAIINEFLDLLEK
ncbi:thioredoxin family protein [Ornithobacterium rhinotracheale]|uniref:thioredoxin family protein n=1 Tax=Ornithobacterium rhinotracheale TaxID=28251 RepID=UPI001FF5E0E4|nr:thioredoxin family protein [Ornithobacterium rhinotracheale]MCK0205775.1 thioredoxin family protein [Ornithobacterium rhinotracheale]